MRVVALDFSISLILAGTVFGQDLKQMLQQKAAALKQSAAEN